MSGNCIIENRIMQVQWINQMMALLSNFSVCRLLYYLQFWILSYLLCNLEEMKYCQIIIPISFDHTLLGTGKLLQFWPRLSQLLSYFHHPMTYDFFRAVKVTKIQSIFSISLYVKKKKSINSLWNTHYRVPCDDHTVRKLSADAGFLLT